MGFALDFSDVSFSYPSQAQPLLERLTVQFPSGWTGVVGANGAGKSTLLLLACGLLEPLIGNVRQPGAALYVPQRTDDPPTGLERLLESTEPLACELRGRLGVGGDWLARWSTLSHGERKRAQIAVALLAKPAVLALDEPTNHIDASARRLLSQELRSFTGVGLLVSHDRQLLDDLCGQCLFVQAGSCTLRPGGYSAGQQQAQADRERARHLREQASRQVRNLASEMVTRRERAAKEHKVRSKRGIPHKDHDAKGRINLARLTDSKAGASLRQLQGRLDHAQQQLAGMDVVKDSPTGIWIESAYSRRDSLFVLPEGELPLGLDRRLVWPELRMRPRDRIAIIGDNGTGKSTLVGRIVEGLELEPQRVVHMPQEITAERSAEIVAEVRRLPHAQLGEVLGAVSRLGSDPTRVLETELPSPGETRKLLLALGIVRQVHLVIMDEPTNHLDLPSIQSLEEALSQCPCGLLLVSHDLTFLRRLTKTVWELNETQGTVSLAVHTWEAKV